MKNGDIRVVWVETAKMVADVLTKPLNGVPFARLAPVLLGDVHLGKEFGIT